MYMCVCVCKHMCMFSHFSCVWLFVTLWTVAHQVPVSMGFSRQECWSGLPCPSPEDLTPPRDQAHVSCFSCIVVGFFTTEPPGKPICVYMYTHTHTHTQWNIIVWYKIIHIRKSSYFVFYNMDGPWGHYARQRDKNTSWHHLYVESKWKTHKNIE